MQILLVYSADNPSNTHKQILDFIEIEITSLY